MSETRSALKIIKFFCCFCLTIVSANGIPLIDSNHKMCDNFEPNYTGTILKRAKIHFKQFENNTDWRSRENETFSSSVWGHIPEEVVSAVTRRALPGITSYGDPSRVMTYYGKEYLSVEHYTGANWNALLLMNVFNQILYANLDKGEAIDAAVKLCQREYMRHQDEINAAASDIWKYITQLELYEYLAEERSHIMNMTLEKAKQAGYLEYEVDNKGELQNITIQKVLEGENILQVKLSAGSRISASYTVGARQNPASIRKIQTNEAGSISFTDIEAPTQKISRILIYSAPQVLDPKDRPEWLQKEINMAFNRLASQTLANYEQEGYNGAEHSGWVKSGDPYNTWSPIDPVKYVLALARRGADEIYIMDIGAGDGNWTRIIAQKLEKSRNFSKTIHLYNLIGEKGVLGQDPVAEEHYGESNDIIIHNIFQCKIEELENALDVNLQGKFDLINTSWTLRHLWDPVGTLVQAYNFLRPGSGMITGDNFNATYENYSQHAATFRTANMYIHNMLSIIKKIGCHFIFLNTEVCEQNDFDCPEYFIIQRADRRACNLPISYVKEDDGQTILKCEASSNASEVQSGNTVCGDRQLYKSLKEMNVFSYNERGSTLRAFGPNQENSQQNYFIMIFTTQEWQAAYDNYAAERREAHKQGSVYKGRVWLTQEEVQEMRRKNQKR